MFNSKGLFLIALAGFTALANANTDNTTTQDLKLDVDAYVSSTFESEKGWSFGKGKGKNGNGNGKKKAKNFIMVIPDGFGPASETMARNWVHWNNNDTVSLPIDEMVIGQIRTKATDSYVTDSAASATAYSCGIKSYNGAIGVNPEYEPCGTVLEAAHLQGFKTGLIATSRITHATPASYASHVYDRDLEANIALQEIGHAHPLGRTVDLLLGGGRCFFTPNTTAKSCRDDGIDALALAKGLGYNVFTTRKEFDALPTGKLPYLGLFTEDHMSYEIDRNPKVEPSLAEMAIKGLNDLHAATKKSDKGFFIMVEASRIDHAGHANDATGHLHDILAYNEAMKAMREWINKHEDDSPTVLISTADHECGGLTLGYELDGAPEYWFAPEHFKDSKATAGVLASQWKSAPATTSAADAKPIFAKYGISAPTNEELTQALALKGESSKFSVFLASALSKRLGANWATAGHTGSDVTLYGWGVGHMEFAGQHENTAVGGWVKDVLGLDLKKVQRKLAANETWLKEFVQPKDTKQAVRRRGELAMHHH